MAVDVFARDQVLDQAEGVVAGGQDVLQHLGLERSTTLPVKLLPILTPPLTAPPLRVLAPAPSSAASSTQASKPESASSMAQDKPGITAADDRHARGLRHVDEVAGNRPVGLPPVGRRLEILVEDVARHRRPALSCLLFSSARSGAVMGQRNQAPSSRSADISTICMADTAATVGSIFSLMMLSNIFFGNVMLAPEMNMATTSSSNEVMKARNAAE